jgi:hypothetical protein
MSFDDLFRKDRSNKTLQRTADQHCDFTMTDSLKLNVAFDAQRLAAPPKPRHTAPRPPGSAPPCRHRAGWRNEGSERT